MTTKYVIQRFNEKDKFWSTYDTTYCQVDAMVILHTLKQQGYQASITRETVGL